MDDLSNLDWNASKAAPLQQQASASRGNYYPTLRPTPPISGRSTPIPPSFPPSSQKPASNAATGSSGSTPANDSFANLVSFNGAQSIKNLSLQEQQQKLKEEKAKLEAEKERAFDRQFGATALSNSAWGTLGDGRTTPHRITEPPVYTATSEYGGHSLSKVINKPFVGIPPPSHSPSPQPATESENDILAAFNASAPVDKSSHMPTPSRTISSDLMVNGTAQPAHVAGVTTNGFHTSEADHVYDDDDPFGLGMAPSKYNTSQKTATQGNEITRDNDDVLGMLSRPVSEFPKSDPKNEEMPKPSKSTSKNPKTLAINELVDMGFEPSKCRVALESTESGIDVQAAVGWLLNQAHEESKNQSRKPKTSNDGRDGALDLEQPNRAPKRRTSSNAGGARPMWMNQQDTAQPRQNSKSPVNHDKDPTQYASELGNSLFKTANSLWKTGQKKLNQAVADFNSAEGVDPSQPKWMRDASQETIKRKPRPNQLETVLGDHGKTAEHEASRSEGTEIQPKVTDEALLLEAREGSSSRKNTTRAKPEPTRKTLEPFEDQGTSRLPKAREDPLSQPKFMQQVPRDPRSKLSRQAVEDEAATAYISPARRKKSTPKPQIHESRTDPDLLLNNYDAKAPQTSSSSMKPVLAAQKARPSPSKSLPIRPSPPKRVIPPLSSIAMQSSTASRKAGTEAFKRGDYALATVEYNKALSALPPAHPLSIVVLTNRALSHSKNGDPKASIADAKSTIDFLGPSRGVGEIIDLGGNEGTKPMDSYWGKAIQRKAEGLEHLEHWVDAAAAWRTCVEAGVGGATSIAGRNRCENATKPKAPPATVKKAAPRPRPSALSDLAPTSAHSAEAVNRLRAANAAADKLDEEKFRLADIVDDRVSQWRAGKEGNLRALLASLENVLWPDAGWKKTGMGELIQTNKVKIIYMRGIGKVHPDKLPTTATTDQKMISAAVFATLNEAWEKFKAENNM